MAEINIKRKNKRYGFNYNSLEPKTSLEVGRETFTREINNDNEQIYTANHNANISALADQKDKIREWIIDTLAYPDIKEFDKRFGKQLKKAEKIE